MARKHLLTNLSSPQGDAPARSNDSRSEYTRRGASLAMRQSLDELAENSVRLLEGETVVSLDPALLDGSFIADRIGSDEAEFLTLREAIKASGQSTPILVRPHPDEPGRYMIVFGHRRARAARELGLPVRAVVKQIEDIAHVIAQGQENTVRSDLTFIERARFAKRLLEGRMSKDVIKAALSVDDTLLSRMLAVADVVPEEVLDAVGAARGVGRDRWEELKKLILIPANAERAKIFATGEAFSELSEENRFNPLLAELKSLSKPKRPSTNKGARKFALGNDEVVVATQAAGKKYTLALTSKDAASFGAFVSDQLEGLYRVFRDQHGKNGD